MVSLLKNIFQFNWLIIMSGGNGRKKQKLSKKDYEQLLSGFRMLSPHIRENVSKLVYHVEYCHEAINRLENEIRELKQTKFFDAQKQIEEHGLKPPEFKREEKVYYPLPTRLRLLLEQDKFGQPEWERQVRYAGLTDDIALKIAKGELDYEQFTKEKSLSRHLSESA